MHSSGTRPQTAPEGAGAEGAGPATDTARTGRGPGTPPTATVEIVLPVHDEERDLARSVRRLHGYLAGFPFPWSITIADNASTDATGVIADELAAALEGVRALHLPDKGRGGAIRAAWESSTASILVYMDVDLSTDLAALLPLVAPLASGHSDLSVGSRLAFGAQVARGPKREAISRLYNLLVRAALRSGSTDAQCGFKAVRADVAHELLPLVRDDAWFFDTELLVLAHRLGLRVHEVPVDWVDDPRSSVDLPASTRAALRGVWRLLSPRQRQGTSPGLRRRELPARSGLAGQVVRFCSIGIVSTAAFALLFAALYEPLGPPLADVVALGVCSVANTAANRRLTFALRGRWGRARHYLAGLVIGVVPLALNLAALAVLSLRDATSLGTTLLTLTAVNASATVARFALLRWWVFGTGATRR